MRAVSTCRSKAIRPCCAPTRMRVSWKPSRQRIRTGRSNRNEPRRRDQSRNGRDEAAGFGRDPVARGQGQRRGMGDPRRPGGRLPDGRPLRLGRPHLHPFVGTHSGTRAPLPAQSVQSDVRGGDRVVAGEGRRERQSGRADAVHHQSGRLHHPFGDPHGAGRCACSDASAHARGSGGVRAFRKACCR